MKKLLLFIMISSPVIAESPFHTELFITSPYLSTTGYGGARRNNIHVGFDCHAINFYPVIYPIMPGFVTEVNQDKIYGKYVVIKTVLLEDKLLSSGEIIPSGTVLFHKYAHGKMIYFSASGDVDTDTKIMIIGKTGYADGVHLHLETWTEINGVKKYYNPEEFI